MENHLLTFLGVLCERFADILTEWSRRLIRCPQCGRSQYYGKPCINGRTRFH